MYRRLSVTIETIKANSMKVLSIGVVAFLLIAVATTAGKILNKCTLARSLYRYGVPYSDLPDWVCLTEHESSYNTKAINSLNYDGSVDWGLFQINDRYWCKPSDGRKSANICRLPCKALLSNNIKYAVYCAKIIMKEQGLTAWVAWNQHCQGPKPSVAECFVR